MVPIVVMIICLFVGSHYANKIGEYTWNQRTHNKNMAMVMLSNALMGFAAGIIVMLMLKGASS